MPGTCHYSRSSPVQGKAKVKEGPGAGDGWMMEMTVGKKHGELESEEKRKERLGKKERKGEERVVFGMSGEI